MKQSSKFIKRIKQLFFVLLICLIIGPEIFIFLPDIILYFDIAGLEIIITTLFMFLKPVRIRIEQLLSLVCNNKYFIKFGMLIIFILIAHTLPELFEFIEIVGVCLLLTCMLMSLKENMGYLVPKFKML